jgi:hypothetical protein
VAAVAEGLSLAAAAGAPEVGFAGLEFDLVGATLGDNRVDGKRVGGLLRHAAFSSNEISWQLPKPMYIKSEIWFPFERPMVGVLHAISCTIQT